MTIRFEAEALAALRAVAQAEELLAGPLEHVVTNTKGSRRDVVSNLDLLLEKAISESLAETGIPVVGEEGYDAGLTALDAGRPAWLVDPIDGTANFLTGMPFYAISVGLLAGGAFPVGAVSLPAFKELYFTHGDQGAFVNGRRLQVSPSTLEEALVGVSIPGTPEGVDHFSLFREVNAASRGGLRLGSAAAVICFLASGRLQGAYGFRAKLWDVGGALAVAAQSGCEVWTRFHAGGPFLDYVVGVPGVAGPLRALLAAQGALPKEAL